MKRFLAIQNIIQLKRQLEGEADPKRRTVIERLLSDEEAVLLLSENKLSGRIPFLAPSPGICGGPTPRLVPSVSSRSGSVNPESADFDHRQCPNCEALMRLVYIQPRELHRDDGYDVHHFRCENCLNSSRFVFERNLGERLPASDAQSVEEIPKRRIA